MAPRVDLFSRVLVTGDRNWGAQGKIWNVLDYIRSGHRMVIIEGGARGADKAARDWARGNHNVGVDLEEYVAHWQRYGKSAGPIRNREQMNKGKPTFVLGFHNDICSSSGTADQLALAADYDVPYAVLTETDCDKVVAYDG